jgi:hypothetical protein
MPVLLGALLCDAARDYSGKVSILGGFVSILYAPEVPTISPLWFAGRVAYSRDEVADTHVMIVRVRAETSGEQLAEVLATQRPQDPGRWPDSEVAGGANLVFPLPFQIQSYGLYWVDLIVDGDLMLGLPLSVNSPPPAP